MAWFHRLARHVTPSEAQRVVALCEHSVEDPFAFLAERLNVPAPAVRWVDRASERACERSCVKRRTGLIEFNEPYLMLHSYGEPSHRPLPRGIPHHVFIKLHEFGHYLQYHRRGLGRFGDEEDADAFAEALIQLAQMSR